MNLTGYTFALPGATLHVAIEKPLNANISVFLGTFHDAASGIDITNVTGQLQHIGPNLDKMVFQGSGAKGAETEKVAFNGDLHESTVPVMFGQLTENYSLPVALWTVTRMVEGAGRR
jgi:hypothetical protein